MEPAYMSAFAALIGTFIGGITSIATSWLGIQRQTREQRLARTKTELQAIYKQFILEASKMYIDALEHEETEMSKLVDLHATLNLIRILSSPKVIEEADNVLRTIITTYGEGNKKFSDLVMTVKEGNSDPLRAFSEACQYELREF